MRQMRDKGQSSIEVLVILAFTGLLLTYSPASPVQQLRSAVLQHFAKFSEAVSRP